VLLAVPAVVRGWRHARRHAGRDAPATLLEFAVTGLPESHQDWGRGDVRRTRTGPRRRSAVGLQSRLRARVGRDPGARDTGLSPARRRRPPRRDRRRALGELGARGYDRQLLRDLPHSGAPDLATLAVSDALTSTLTLLILVPLTALASGSLAARLPRTAGPVGTSAPPGPAPRP